MATASDSSSVSCLSDSAMSERYAKQLRSCEGGKTGDAAKDARRGTRLVDGASFGRGTLRPRGRMASPSGREADEGFAATIARGLLKRI